MKNIITALVISVSLISISANAQTSKPMHAKGDMGGMKQMLKDSLHLTDAQSDSVVSIREEFMGKIKQLKRDTSVSADKRKEEIKPLREEMKTRLKAVLTKEQMDKFQQMQQGMQKGKTDDDQ